MPAEAPPIADPAFHPLSPLQEGFLYHSLSEAEPGADVVQLEGDLREEIDPAAFARAWELMAERHPILRTAFVWDELGRPAQIVHAHLGSARPIDPTAVSDISLESWREEEWRRPFALDQAPLFRLRLRRIGPARHRFLFTFHHLLLDLRALGVLLREAFTAYEALAADRLPALAPAYSYHDYLAWVQAAGAGPAEAFWRNRLAGFTAPTPLPGAAAGQPGAATAERDFTAPDGLLARLRTRAGVHGVTLNTLVQGAWALLLGRHAGVEDVVFGAIRAGRRAPVPGAESMVGLLINTVPVRVNLAGGQPVTTWLQELRRQWIDLRPFEQVPLSRVQSWSELPPGEGLFTTLVNFQDPPWDASLRTLGGAWANRDFHVRSRPTSPLALDAWADDDEFRLRLLFDPRIFREGQIDRLFDQLCRLLEALTGELQRPLGEIELTSAEERRHLLQVLGGAPHPPFPASTLLALIEAEVEKNGRRLALSDSFRRLNYAEWDAESGQLAAYLQQRGVKAGDAVAVCLPRSADLVVAWYGILKAGAAFVPLDPAYPAERLELLFRESGAELILSDEAGRARLPAGRTESVTSLAAALNSKVPPARAVAVTPESLAYIIFTSGSTGTPKGVEIEHRSLCDLIEWHRQSYQVRPDDRASQVASPSFDAAVWEIWPYLASGASVHFPGEDLRLSPARLIGWLAAQGITMAFLPTPLAEAVLAEPWPRTTALRFLLTGGDRLRRRPPPDFPCPVVNHYGPTEAAVVATAGLVRPEGSEEGEPSIGRPIAHARAYVVDGRLRPVPAGVPGELLVGGSGVARGYHSRPELTREKFLPDPHRNDPGARVYRTGDRVCWRLDGQLEFLGRLDDQVKIRGHRIEPGEIEAALVRHPAVAQAVVAAREGRGGDLSLVAYVVPRGSGSPPLDEDLVAFLSACLPDALVPRRYVWLGHFPLTVHGKIDRRALPAPIAAEPTAKSPLRTPAESKLAAIWRQVLPVKEIGPNDNFFSLGGHSLLAAQAVARIRREFGLELGVRALFDHPTLSSLAAALENAETRPAPVAAIRSRHPARSAAEGAALCPR